MLGESRYEKIMMGHERGKERPSVPGKGRRDRLTVLLYFAVVKSFKFCVNCQGSSCPLTGYWGH